MHRKGRAVGHRQVAVRRLAVGRTEVGLEEERRTGRGNLLAVGEEHHIGLEEGSRREERRIVVAVRMAAAVRRQVEVVDHMEADPEEEELHTGWGSSLVGAGYRRVAGTTC